MYEGGIYIFDCVSVGAYESKGKIDVFLQTLIAELKSLWGVGVQTYDISKRQNFQMRAALMWTINEFPVYFMTYGWSTAGMLACPHCMEDSDAFRLIKSGKQSWFDNHRKFLPMNHPYRRNTKDFIKNRKVTKQFPGVRYGDEILQDFNNRGLRKVIDVDAEVVNAAISKTCGWNKRSIFLDLPYWREHLLRHNLYVMHIEKNVFDNIFNTVFNIPGKTKDTYKSRDELHKILSPVNTLMCHLF